jgi:hypothetical protein
MWEPRRLTTLNASTVCYRDSFTFFYIYGFFNSAAHISGKVPFTGCVINERTEDMDKGGRRPIDIIPEFTWRDWEIPQELSVKTVGFTAEIRSRGVTVQ